ncbi:MAG: glycosyltransferase family 2 protein [Bacteroidaceae bacterium]
MSTDNTLPPSDSADSPVPPSEQQKPLITVVTVTYNAAQTLDRTLQSVANQDYPRMEHLIVDGCSTDGTLGMVQMYVAENTRTSHPHHIRLICEHDSGLYDAMNKAIANAFGDYLLFLNAGDCLHDVSTISTAVGCADWRKGDARNPAILYGETDLVDADGRFLRHRRLSVPGKLSSCSFLSGMLVCHQSFYVRTDLARLTPYDLRYRLSADYDWCIRLMRLAERRRLQMVNVHAVLTDYLAEGMTTRHHRASLMERLRIMAFHYGWTRALAAHAWFVIRALLKR